MSKTLKKVVTLILVLVMLFGMSAFTIGAVADGAEQSSAGSEGNTSTGGNASSSQSSGTSGSLITGWFDVTYDTDTKEIKVVITPDKDAVLGVTKAQLKEIATKLVEAIKEVALSDIVEEFGGFELLEGELNADNVWQKALDVYLSGKYPEQTDKKMAFIKEVLDPTPSGDTTVGNLRITDFAGFVADLLRAAILLNPDILDVLPDVSKIDTFIEETLESILYEQIDNYIHKIVEDYIVYAQLEDKTEYDEDEHTDLELIKKVEDYMHDIVREEVDKYVSNLSKLPQDDKNASLDDLQSHLDAMQNDVVYKYLSNYIDDEITSLKNEVSAYVDSYITAKLNGQTLPTPGAKIIRYVPDAQEKIQNKIDSEISKVIETYVKKRLDPSVETFAGYDYFEQFINSFVNGAVEDIVDNYIFSKTGDGESKEIVGIGDSLHTSIKEKIDAIFKSELQKREVPVFFKNGIMSNRML